jgi:hypothetical protein
VMVSSAAGVEADGGGTVVWARANNGTDKSERMEATFMEKVEPDVLIGH